MEKNIQSNTAVVNNPIADLLQTLEQSAAKLASSAEDKAQQAIATKPWVTLGIGFSLGIAFRLIQQTLPPGSLAKVAKTAGLFLAKNAATWATQAIAAQKRA